MERCFFKSENLGVGNCSSVESAKSEYLKNYNSKFRQIEGIIRVPESNLHIWYPNDALYLSKFTIIVF